DLPASAAELALANLCQAQAEARQRIGRVERDRLLEGRLGILRVDAHQVRVPQYRLGPRKIRLEGGGFLRGVERATELAEQGPHLRQSRPGEGILRVELDGLPQVRASALEVEPR